MQINLSQLLVAVALSPIVSAVSLSDFKPRVDSLPAACDKVYKASIFGCQPSDFTGSSCSSLCIKALQSYVGDVQRACFGQQGTNIITAFLTASGPSQLCSNAQSSPAASSTSSSSIISPSGSASSSTSSPSAKSTTDQPTTTLAPATNTPTNQPTSTTSVQPTPTSASGGYGSPFDVGTNSVSAASSEPARLSLALVGALAFVVFAL